MKFNSNCKQQKILIMNMNNVRNNRIFRILINNNKILLILLIIYINQINLQICQKKQISIHNKNKLTKRMNNKMIIK